MNSRDFCYWLMGYMEITEKNQTVTLTSQQVQCIKNHLNLVFHHDIDKQYSEDQKLLQDIHDGKIEGVSFKHPPIVDKEVPSAFAEQSNKQLMRC